MVGLIAALTEIPEDTLRNDPQIGADGLLEIVDAFLEVNAAENFIRAAGRLRQHIGRLAATLKPGSSGLIAAGLRLGIPKRRAAGRLLPGGAAACVQGLCRYARRGTGWRGNRRPHDIFRNGRRDD